MCGRYVIARATGDLARPLRALPGDTYQERISYNVAPTTPVPILVERERDGDESLRELHTARWGLLPVWAKDKTFSSRTFNARSETVIDKASFRSAVRSRRCVVLADAYYEWKTIDGAKQPHAIRPKDSGLILFAGLYEWWKDPASEEWVLSTTILTGPSPDPGDGGVLDELADLHDRMPLAMNLETFRAWITPGKLEKPDAETLVEQVRAGAYDVAAGWEIYPVDKAVGNTRSSGAALLARV